MNIEADQNYPILTPRTPTAGITETLTHKENNIYTKDTSTETFFKDNTFDIISSAQHFLKKILI